MPTTFGLNRRSLLCPLVRCRPSILATKLCLAPKPYGGNTRLVHLEGIAPDLGVHQSGGLGDSHSTQTGLDQAISPSTWMART